MAHLSRGITFDVNGYLSAARLHALIDTAIAAGDAFPGTPTLYGIVMGDFVSGLKAVHVASSPASPVTNDLAVGSDGLLDRYNGVGFEDVTRNVDYFVNGSSITLTTGTPVVPDPASAANCNIYASAGTCPDPLGICQTVAAPGATASIAVRGFCLALVNNSLAVPIGAHLSLQGAGATALSSTSSIASDVMAFCAYGEVANLGNKIRLVSLVR